ncbi:MAG TPA: ATP-dependent 6-phosphofructokinase [Acidimicrobiales bacterium]|nr:ATP-dependent 6-phosphofructokinase [Acidimicrobiales bacterium]
MRRVGVLTSGGDAPGMNACIRAVVRAGLERGLEVVGIRRGFEGMLAGEVEVLDRARIVNIVHRGGTILGTARSERFRTVEGCIDAVGILRHLDIDGLVLIGGDGTFRGGAALESAGGPPTVGVPGTIDNDVVGTDRSLGFDTAVNSALWAIDRIRDTATSHEVLHFVEVMGRHCGAIALASGVAGGAEAVLIPETTTDEERLAGKIGEAIARGKRSAIVVVAEGTRPGGARVVAEYVGARLGLEYRVTVLGHIQRGGAPTATDRILAGLLGVEAVDALADGASGVAVGEVAGRLVRTPYADDGVGPRLDPKLLAVAALLA